MKFKREGRFEEREVTPQIYAAAVRAVKKEREMAGLFGEELMRFTTPEERLEQMARRSKEICARWRTHEARGWRRARRELRMLPAVLRLAVMKRWNSDILLFNNRRTATALCEEIRDARIMPQLRYLEMAGLVSRAPEERAWGDDLLKASEHRSTSLKSTADAIGRRLRVKLSSMGVQRGAMVFIMRDIQAAQQLFENESWIVDHYNALLKSLCPSAPRDDFIEVVRVDYRPGIRESYILGNGTAQHSPYCKV